MEKIEKMNASKKFRNVDLNPIKNTAITLVRYASKRDNLGVKFGKTRKMYFPLNITGQSSGNTYPASISIN